MPATEITLVPVIREVIEDCLDRKRMSAGIDACEERKEDFSSRTQMQLAGIAMVAEARDLMTERLTKFWETTPLRRLTGSRTAMENLKNREVIIGAGFHAAVYAASRVRMGFPRPVVLERGSGDDVGGAFAVSHKPVFRLNSRTRPGIAGLPDQDKALNYIPGGLLQPDMVTSEEYIDNSLMAWLIRLTLAQFAEVIPYAAVTELDTKPFSDEISRARFTIGDGKTLLGGRALDARGTGNALTSADPETESLHSFTGLMARMGGMFPLRGMRQVAVIGGGDSARCACESLLGIAPGHTSSIGLDYVTRVDWYAGQGVSGEATCSEFREGQRGRYIRLAQYLDGNESNPSTRLRKIGTYGYATTMPDGVIVNERTYDMAIDCTGYALPDLAGQFAFSQFRGSPTATATVLAKRAAPFELYRIGPVADLPFSEAEISAGISDIPANKVSMFRLAPRTAALAAMLPDVPGK